MVVGSYLTRHLPDIAHLPSPPTGTGAVERGANLGALCSILTRIAGAPVNYLVAVLSSES